MDKGHALHPLIPLRPSFASRRGQQISVGFSRPVHWSSLLTSLSGENLAR
jgi:hypothetical protein